MESRFQSNNLESIPFHHKLSKGEMVSHENTQLLQIQCDFTCNVHPLFLETSISNTKVCTKFQLYGRKKTQFLSFHM